VVLITGDHFKMMDIFFGKVFIPTSNYHFIVNVHPKLLVLSISSLNYLQMSMSPLRPTKRQKYPYKLEKKKKIKTEKKGKILI
jgi:hypothetical protein